MALTSTAQALSLAAEVARLRLALTEAVLEQDRLTLRNAELAEMLAVMEAERDALLQRGQR